MDQIENGQVPLPEFQRRYVWNRDQVRGLVRSLYKRYPVGSLLAWNTNSAEANACGVDLGNAGQQVKMLLDGQQRMTSLYGIIKGKPPAFFDGNPNALSGLYFNVETEKFSFFMPSKMQGNPLWIDVTRLMKDGADGFLQAVLAEHQGGRASESDAVRPLAVSGLDDKSRMSREAHVRFCEHLGGRFPGVTRPSNDLPEDFKAIWRAFWHAVNQLQYLPNFSMATRKAVSTGQLDQLWSSWEVLADSDMCRRDTHGSESDGS